MKIVVTGHGKFASGLKSTVSLLAGKIPNIVYVDFLETMTDEDLAKRFKETLTHSPDAIFFCDLVGGTPYKQAALLSTEFPNIAVIAGCNIGSLLEVGLQNDLTEWTDTQKVSNLLIDASHDGIKKFGENTYIQEIDDDGI